MKKFLFPAFFMAIIFLGCSSNDDCFLNFNGKKYELTFSDDFESGKMDKTKWRYSPQMERQDAGGWWKNKCSSFEDGNYVITCTIADDGTTPISGGIQTNGKVEQAFGLFHIRFKIEKADGSVEPEYDQHIDSPLPMPIFLPLESV